MKINQGEVFPVGYGLAWFDYSELRAVVFLIPFNFIFRWARRLYLVLRGQGSRDATEAYRKGYAESDEYWRKELRKRDEEWSRAVGLAILAEREKKEEYHIPNP